MERVQTEYESFSKTHRDRLNILFHVFCGTIYTASLVLLVPFNYSFVFLIYVALIAILLDLKTALLSGAALAIGINIILSLKPSVPMLLTILAIFYVLPEASHLLTGEKTVLKIDDISIIDIAVNIISLLPFSVKTLLNAS